jgi:hypothetical protein
MSRRGGWILAAIVVLVLGLATVPGLIHRQVLGLGAKDIHDIATLPDRISVCGRGWTMDTSGRVLSGADIRPRPGGGPPRVDPLPLAPCPPGPCTNSALDTPCATVVVVRIGEDAYVDYALSGGP